MKLEAEDISNNLVCCATILELRGNRAKIRYDGWAKKFDAWIRLDSGHLHPVGWCQEMEVPLCPPKGKTYGLKLKIIFNQTRHVYTKASSMPFIYKIIIS